MPWFADRVGPPAARDVAAKDVASRTVNNVGTSEVITFRGSIARPARTPTNASLGPCGPQRQDSGPPWFATPFGVGLFHAQLHAR